MKTKKAKNRVMLCQFKLSGDADDFQMTIKEAKEYIKLQIEDEESPFVLTALKVEVENQR